jgi:hypothetical protein
VLGIDFRRDAVAEVEHVAGVIAVAVEHGAGLAADHFGTRAQDRRIEVALQGDAVASAACVAEIDGPVDAQRGAAGVGRASSCWPAPLENRITGRSRLAVAFSASTTRVM